MSERRNLVKLHARDLHTGKRRDDGIRLNAEKQQRNLSPHASSAETRASFWPQRIPQELEDKDSVHFWHLTSVNVLKEETCGVSVESKVTAKCILNQGWTRVYTREYEYSPKRENQYSHSTSMHSHSTREYVAVSGEVIICLIWVYYSILQRVFTSIHSRVFSFHWFRILALARVSQPQAFASMSIVIVITSWQQFTLIILARKWNFISKIGCIFIVKFSSRGFLGHVTARWRNSTNITIIRRLLPLAPKPSLLQEDPWQIQCSVICLFSLLPRPISLWLLAYRHAYTNRLVGRSAELCAFDAHQLFFLF